MQRDLIVKSRSLGGTSDLTLLASIKPGFVDSLEAVTYKTRVKRVLETLHGARVASHEYAVAQFLSDAVERVGAIHSVRVAVLEPEDKVLLAVTFDGSWESYIRVLWDKVGTLLDLIFCSTTDYVTAMDHSFDEWLAWARRVQVETGFFYGPPDFSARDVWYHRRVERMRQRGLGSDLNELRARAPSAEDAVSTPYGDQADDHPPPPLDEYSAVRSVVHGGRAGLQALAGLHRLTDLFRPGTPDGVVLRNASLNLLQEFAGLVDRTFSELDFQHARERFSRELDWLYPDGNFKLPAPRRPQPFEDLGADTRMDVQGGILQAYDGATHGLLLLLHFDMPASLASFLEHLQARLPVTTDIDDHQAAGGRVFANLAFTFAGLRACGLDEDELELFPEDFRQGMAARAGSLGDVRSNHPRRWRLPRRFAGLQAAPADDAIDLAAVHAVLQLRCEANGAGTAAVDYWDPAHPLASPVQGVLDAKIPGLSVLSIQSMRRELKEWPGKPKQILDHFGFADGGGQPDLSPAPANKSRVHLGEVVLGHNNAADATIDPAGPSVPEDVRSRMAWLKNGSFMVMRKYRQNVDRLRSAVEEAAAEMQRETNWPLQTCIDLVYAKLVGRYQNGDSLVPPRPGGGMNDFDFEKDPAGDKCPLHAHIRRSHPRSSKSGVRPPRLMRRGMSYGPPASAGPADRGLVFMAFNASLSEQFEVVQRWLTGGNSTGASSGQACPIVGVPENGWGRHYRFVYTIPATMAQPATAGTPAVPAAPARDLVLNVQLEVPPNEFQEPESITRLDWGLYLFTPSVSALHRLERTARAAATATPRATGCPWKLGKGREIVRALQVLETTHGAAAAAEAWKAAIEDPDAIDRLDSAALWAAIRDDHGGVLRTPYGVLVAGRDLVQQVYNDVERYSVSGQRARMIATIGDIYLGKDDGPDDGPAYRTESAGINSVIEALDPGYVFLLARTAAERKLEAIRKSARDRARDCGDTRYEVLFDAHEVVDEVLADLTEDWFGIDKGPFRRSGTDWSWTEGDPPLYPGHFTAISRYMFQPNPGPTVEKLARSYGRALHKAMLAFVEDHLRKGTVPQSRFSNTDAVIAHATLTHPYGKDSEFSASTMVGVIMGFTPTIIGAVLNVLKEWRIGGDFSRLRGLVAASPVADLTAAAALIAPRMKSASKMRPMPQIVWRTAKVEHRIADGVTVAKGEKVVLANVSGTQQSLADGRPDGRLMFGGTRKDGSPPTHACPGYDAGIAAMLGTLTALLSFPDAVQDGPGSGTFEIRGDSGFVPAAPVASLELKTMHLDFEWAALSGGLPGVTMPEDGSRDGLVLAWGDSWLAFKEVVIDFELRDWLEQFGFEVPKTFCAFRQYLYLEKMEQDKALFADHLRDNLSGLKAVILSGGGNDSVELKLQDYLLNDKGAASVINRQNLEEHVKTLRERYVSILDAITPVLAGGNIPIILHGYDHPVPAKKGFPQWIRIPFWNRGYKDPAAPSDNERCDVPVAQAAMKELIDALNDMAHSLAQQYPQVRYVDLRGSVATLKPQHPVDGWFDNLHPMPDSFKWMAAKIAGQIP